MQVRSHADVRSDDEEFVATCKVDATGNRLSKVTDDYDSAKDETVTSRYVFAAGDVVNGTALPPNDPRVGTLNRNDLLLGETSDKASPVSTTTTTYTYDNNGSMTGKSINGTATETYTWDLRGRMTSATVGTGGSASTTIYRYDTSNSRTEKKITVGTTTITTRYIIDPQNQTGYAKAIEERNATNAPTKSYVLGIDVIAELDSGSTTIEHLLQDGRGFTRALTAGDGMPVGTLLDQDAFGNSLNSTPAGTEWIAPDGRSDLETGFTYQLARYGVRQTGRFASADQLITGAGQVADANRYVLSFANPSYRVDPSGFFSFTIGDLLGAMGIDSSIKEWKDLSAARINSEVRSELATNITDAFDWRESGENAALASTGTNLWLQRLTSLGYYVVNLQSTPVGSIGPDLLALSWNKGRLRLMVGEVKAMSRSRVLSSLDKLSDGTIQMSAGWIAGHVQRFLAPAVSSIISSAAGQLPPALGDAIKTNLSGFQFDVYLLRARKYKSKGWKLRGIELLQIGTQGVGRTSDADAVHQRLVGEYPDGAAYLNDFGV